jgi:glycine cleavage system H protein
MYPENFKYSKEHEWIQVEGDTGTIGITDHAQNELGDIVYVDLPKIGMTVAPGETLGSVESVKAVSDIYSPVSGEVVAVNADLAASPEKLNAEVKLSNPTELDALLSAADYQAYLGE